MDEKKELWEVKTASQEIYKGRLLHVFKDTVDLPNGSSSTREFISHLGAVGAVAITDDGKVVLERQFRYPLGKVITEIPAGKLNSPEEDRLEAMKRELREETGITADEWSPLGDYYPSAAYCTECVTLFMAKGLHRGERELDEDEFLNVIEMPLKEAVRMVMDNEIADGKTIAGILKAARILGI